ncbi:hypothetical protein DUNSADRAFT_14230 [Dunaliella salina]|uniref:Uncharacterized protein n=1 Tax=Dunaliella salina TaxID=3046 RepID=A0ABQ7G7S9_DUNSA|nr:hypothetical protein DUNSADRAFT_14230 [Dunaliella salina]|eukprot:KAF5830648.1 hypothetical protein DUNSADRAFT_14230 [Dunaliella salina]
MVVPDGGECVLAQLHDSADPASFFALSLLHFPIPASSPIIIAQLLEQLPEVTVHWVARVSDRGAEGPCLTNFVSFGGSPRGNSSSSLAEAPLPPPFFTPVPYVAQACQSGHGLALVSRAIPLARRGRMKVASLGRTLNPLPLRRIPSALLAPRVVREERQRQEQLQAERQRLSYSVGSSSSSNNGNNSSSKSSNSSRSNNSHTTFNSSSSSSSSSNNNNSHTTFNSNSSNSSNSNCNSHTTFNSSSNNCTASNNSTTCITTNNNNGNSSSSSNSSNSSSSSNSNNSSSSSGSMLI